MRWLSSSANWTIYAIADWEWNHGAQWIWRTFVSELVYNLRTHTQQATEYRIENATVNGMHIFHTQSNEFQLRNNTRQRNAIRLLNGSSVYFAYSLHMLTKFIRFPDKEIFKLFLNMAHCSCAFCIGQTPNTMWIDTIFDLSLRVSIYIVKVLFLFAFAFDWLCKSIKYCPCATIWGVFSSIQIHFAY